METDHPGLRVEVSDAVDHVTVVERDPLGVLQRRGERVLRVRAPLRLPPNGNLTFKSDVDDLSYDDPLHPHAVTGAGTDTFAHDAVGNQTARPGGTTVRYTPFDLPEQITQGASTITFGYDGDQQRIRKTTAEKETLYFGDLYERVTDAASGAVEQRYHVHSPERVVAIVTRGGSDDGTRYVHVDHLGSIDALTDEDGAVIERRSYDPFGQRRNPVWGERPPASFPSETTQGFTGHESDGAGERLRACKVVHPCETWFASLSGRGSRRSLPDRSASVTPDLVAPCPCRWPTPSCNAR
ncbi:hypothetical protein [Sorangium sp. So ce145]|uniref:hypothetical protein n=1 Tax=Sorangium sp. So ce145 TaxID=3133285 RepID=UPI003F640F38